MSALPLNVSGTGSAASTAVPAAPPRLVKAAHEFEAALMKELLAPMVPGHNTLGEDDEAGSASALGDFAAETLGKALSEQGGFGIATSIVRQLTPHAHAQSNRPAAHSYRRQ